MQAAHDRIVGADGEVLVAALRATDAKTNGWIGRALPRVEDDRLVRGAGCFVDDLTFPDSLHLVLLRSPLARGTIRACDLDAAAASEGVVAVFSARDVCGLGAAAVNPLLPGMQVPGFPLLADRVVEALGQPIAAVLADSEAAGRDALDKIDLALDALPLRENEAADRAIAHRWRGGDAAAGFANAVKVVEARFAHARLAPAPMEPRAAAARWDEDARQLTVWLSTQTPHRCRDDLARILALDASRIRVVAPDVGGAFGGKASLHPEDALVAWAAWRLRRPVKWRATRSDDFLAATQGRGAALEGRLALDSEGRALALEARIAYPLGYWMPYSAASPARNAGRILPGPYAVDAVTVDLAAHLTNSAPMNIYRGAGRPEAAMLMERLMDRAALSCGLDPVEIRRRNLLPSVALPHRTPTGEVLDSGDYPALLAKACRRAGYNALRERQRAARRQGGIFGIGLSLYVEPCGQGWESATIGLAPDGTIVVATGSTAQGQGRETAFAQIAADKLGVAFERIKIRHGDTAATPPGIGALASRSTAIGGSALVEAAALFRSAARDAAALRLNAAPGEVIADAEGFTSICGRRVGWHDLAVSDTPGLALAQTVRYEAEGETWSSGCCIASVTIDAETGDVAVDRLTWVDDAGRVVNPLLAEGQLIGGMAQGWGEAFCERIVYDEDGQLLTGSFMDYAMPRATDIPAIRLDKMETPAANPLGAKGVGEAGTIGIPACLVNAVLDALAPFGVEDIDMPMTSPAIWRALQTRKSTTLGALAS